MANARELYAPELWQQLHEQDPVNYPELDSIQMRVVVEAEIRARYAAIMSQVVKPYMQTERETWFTQLKEADEWLANQNVPTPMLSAIAAGRGISLVELVSKVKENDALFRGAIGYYLGKQQAELDALG
jgi:hypothetical protein